MRQKLSQEVSQKTGTQRDINVTSKLPINERKITIAAK